MARKTVEVFKIKDVVNALLSNSCCSQEEKKGYCLIMQEVLRLSDSYKGFTYLYKNLDNEEYSRKYS